VYCSAAVTPDLQLALELADLADGITQPRFRAVDLRVDTKPDSSPVSDADTAVEAAVRRRLGQARPGDAILGEEEGTSGSGERRWLLDPIDGTRNYVRGIPIWATLIALEVAGRPEVGVVSAPALGRRWWAARGTGAFADSGPIRVSRVSRLADAYISTTDWTEVPPGAYEALARAAWTNRALGDFWSHVLVAEGSIDVAVEKPVERWDLAAPLVIVEEAGGRLTDMEGRPRIDSGNVVTTNGLLHEEVLAALRR
jgi:histidinol-phosphatase